MQTKNSLILSSCLPRYCWKNRTNSFTGQKEPEIRGLRGNSGHSHHFLPVTVMGMQGDDDVVQIHKAKKPEVPSSSPLTVPEKGVWDAIFAGSFSISGFTLPKEVLRFLLIRFGFVTFLVFYSKTTDVDVTTDGIWCYIVFWVVPHSSSPFVRWPNLKNRLVSVCPPCSAPFYLSEEPRSSASPLYLLTFFCLDRKGLLHDVTQVLGELELTIQRVKLTTTPDRRVLDLFFITDNLDLLHTKERQDDTYEWLNTVLGESCLSCELKLAGPEYELRQGVSLSPAVEEEIFQYQLSDTEVHSQALSADMKRLKKPIITVDNSLSPAHTLLQIHCIDHKGLLYDVMRTLKDCNINITFGRFSPNTKCYRDLDLFIQQSDGKKILDPEKQKGLFSRLKVEMQHPLRVIIANRGPDTELLVANPVELSGNGRPRVFYDVTLALKSLEVCVFSAEIGRYSASDHEWEVYRFLLDDNCRYQLSCQVARNQIVDRVRRTLMGW